MAVTPPSLLERIRQHPDDAEAWQRFDDLYRPLLSSWLRRHAIQPHDADDLLQEMFQTLLRQLPHFEYDPERGRFRGFLRAILVNQLRNHWRAERRRPEATGDQAFYDKILMQLEDPASDLSRLWDHEHDEHVARRLMALIESDFAPATWQCFQRLIAGESAKEVGADLGISENAAVQSKYRVLKRLRQEMEGLAN